MNIGAIGTSNYYSGYRNNRVTPKTGTKSFGNITVNNTTNIVIHGFMGEKTEAGDTVVGAWGNAVTGTSTTVYKPQNFDENNPVYYMKIWDKDGNVTERTVNLNEIDPQNCNSFDMYAYCCYANDSGKSSSAMTNFMGSHAFYQGEQEAVLTDRGAAILKIMEDLKNECKWNWSSRIPGDRAHGEKGRKKCGIRGCWIYRDNSGKGGTG